MNEGKSMNEEEKKAYVAETSARLKKAISEKLAEIRGLISVEEYDKIVECGGGEAIESILCALDCSCDQINCALDSWQA